jgi:hypothetical protein
MPKHIRPILAVRLIGTPEAVTAEKEHLATRLTNRFGDRVTVRSSTHSASHAGEIRVYVTATLKETHDHTNNRANALGGGTGS